MTPRTLLLAIPAVLSLAAAARAETTCGMDLVTRHGDAAATPIHASTAGEKAIFFTADLDVNTDGAARSYHPMDPRGKSLALNNMGNAITRIFDADEAAVFFRDGAVVGTPLSFGPSFRMKGAATFAHAPGFG